MKRMVILSYRYSYILGEVLPAQAKLISEILFKNH